MFKFFWEWKLINQKKRALFECQQDIIYLETQQAKYLNGDEEQVRDDLFAENKKEKPDANKITELTKTLSKIKSVKAAYEQNLELREGLEKYIAMLSK